MSDLYSDYHNHEFTAVVKTELQARLFRSNVTLHYGVELKDLHALITALKMSGITPATLQNQAYMSTSASFRLHFRQMTPGLKKRNICFQRTRKTLFELFAQESKESFQKSPVTQPRAIAAAKGPSSSTASSYVSQAVASVSAPSSAPPHTTSSKKGTPTKRQPHSSHQPVPGSSPKHPFPGKTPAKKPLPLLQEAAKSAAGMANTSKPASNQALVAVKTESTGPATEMSLPPGLREIDVEDLVLMGFSRSEAIFGLEQCLKKRPPVTSLDEVMCFICTHRDEAEERLEINAALEASRVSTETTTRNRTVEADEKLLDGTRSFDMDVRFKKSWIITKIGDMSAMCATSDMKKLVVTLLKLERDCIRWYGNTAKNFFVKLCDDGLASMTEMKLGSVVDEIRRAIYSMPSEDNKIPDIFLQCNVGNEDFEFHDNEDIEFVEIVDEDTKKGVVDVVDLNFGEFVEIT